MKASVRYKYGSPDGVQFVDMEKPTPSETQVLVKVHAASINSYDWRFVRAVPFLVRTSVGLFKPQDPGLGADFAGTVEAVGSKVTMFKPGDEVFGEVGSGAYTEYLCSPEKALAHKPANVSFEEAAAAPMAALTALQGLRDTGKIQAGQKVLVNGASGGVGTFAVMIAKYYGAEVTGVCSTRNMDMVRSIGADHVIDYTKEDFTKNGKQYDLIYDVAASRSIFDYKRVLAPNGKFVMAGFSTMLHMIHILSLGSLLASKGQQIGMMGTAAVKSEDLAFIAELLGSRKIVPVIDKVFPLKETAKALWHFEKEHARGKIVIKVA
jgi:NADPH:quinone reductase-like Zn-dependent oxidoreductase